jgi:uncharacterized small protein (DUF1192 family)
MLPIYDIEVDEESGVDFNAFVDSPAHMKGFIAFGKNQSVRYSFNEEKRIVTGVMISANTLIYRGARPEIGIPEHYVKFSPETIEQIQRNFHKNGYHNNVNLMHDPTKKVKGVFMVESYIIGSDPKQPKAPEVFSNQKLADGTWIASYKVENDKVWGMVKSGEFYGFSVEGMFGVKEVKIQKSIKMSKSKKSLFSYIFGGSEEEANTEQSFAEATTVDGVTVFYEGELAEGTLVQIIVEGEMIPAPEGDHQIMLSETESVVITLDDTGVVTSVEAVEAETEMEVEAAAETVNAGELKEFAVQFKDEIGETFAAMQKEIDTLKAQLKDLEKSDKFQAQTRKVTESKTVSYKDLIKK